MDAVFGGEGISEGLRDYLLTAFKRVTGSYGASDLEINMAAETPFTIGLRRLIMEDEAVREALTHPEYGTTPMVFQYNPLAYMFETNEQGEFVLNTRGRDGAVIGEHRVTIVANQPFASAVENQAEATSPEEGKPVVSRIPKKFSDLKNSPLTATVDQTAENRFEFHLE